MTVGELKRILDQRVAFQGDEIIVLDEDHGGEWRVILDVIEKGGVFLLRISRSDYANGVAHEREAIARLLDDRARLASAEDVAGRDVDAGAFVAGIAAAVRARGDS